ncbi:hypothetical protein [Aquimarina sp. AU474]|uniref:hypothetical protein n=1 Tax=Aquimarina sp. AU474 TaxID=2108529 RepID=UPI0013570149|nr:hypothetical protein [Aquimarina sp. AU474]
MFKKIPFIILSIVSVLLVIMTNYLLDTNELMLNSLSEQLTRDQFEEFIELNQKWQWVGYLSLPIILFIKVGLISTVLFMGTFLFDKKIPYKTLFRIVTKAEFIFIIVGVIKLIWFSFSDTFTIEEMQSFYPLSALSIIGYEGISPWFIYPFQTLNLFELIYWIILAYLIGKEIDTTTDKALKIVASSYGSVLLIWVVTVMFLTLNMS